MSCFTMNFGDEPQDAEEVGLILWLVHAIGQCKHNKIQQVDRKL